MLSGTETSRARKFLREARELRSKWKQADAKREQQRILLIRKNAQKAEEKQRELRCELLCRVVRLQGTHHRLVLFLGFIQGFFQALYLGSLL